jgi:hypothetical protein
MACWDVPAGWRVALFTGGVKTASWAAVGHRVQHGVLDGDALRHAHFQLLEPRDNLPSSMTSTPISGCLRHTSSTAADNRVA